MTGTVKHAVVAVIRQHDRFLFVKRSDYVSTAAGYWCPVSGRVKAGETQPEALEREVMEEVGLKVKALEKVAEISTHDAKFLLHFWTTEIISGTASITSNEATEFSWVTIAQMKQLSPVFQADIEVFETI